MVDSVVVVMHSLLRLLKRWKIMVPFFFYKISCHWPITLS